uniref:chitin deacetylase n=1 Tax=Psilocybe cubensis TaxID=181762 RepID=A0A8H7XUJ5_PSICU
MRFSRQALLAALPAAVVAHGGRQHHARQNPSGSTTSYTFSLAATNPTAVPLSAINSLQPSSATKALHSTAVAGSVPTFISGAPPLPAITALRAADYPDPDKPAPTDSPEVKRWIQEVKDTGVVIPDLSLNVAAPATGPICTAPENAAAAANSTARCWWTCGGCTRASDIADCPTKLDWGLTFDDGPAPYTPNLMEYLDEKQIKATFFVVGSRVFYNWQTLQSQYMGQHQIAIHTWSHYALTTLTNEQIIAELGWSKKIIKDVLGVTPNMMRPPYGDIDDRVRAISLAMGLTPVMWTRLGPNSAFNTNDFDIHSGTVTVDQALSGWKSVLDKANTIDTGFIALEHDIWQQTVEVATGYILPDALAHQPAFKIQPVVNCLARTMSDAYVETNNNATNPPVFKQAVDAGVVKVSGKPKDTSPAVSAQSAAGGILSLAGLMLGGLLAMP